jgi:hypothetical protein
MIKVYNRSLVYRLCFSDYSRFILLIKIFFKLNKLNFIEFSLCLNLIALLKIKFQGVDFYWPMVIYEMETHGWKHVVLLNVFKATREIKRFYAMRQGKINASLRNKNFI